MSCVKSFKAQLCRFPFLKMKFTTTCKPFDVTGQECIRFLGQQGCEFVGGQTFGPLSGDELLKAIGTADAVIADLDHYDEKIFQGAPDLKLVARWGVGFDAVDIKAATDAGVMVSNTPGVLDETVADLAFALMLGIARQIAGGDRSMREGNWNQTWANDVHSKTLGLIGCGRIGMAVARRALGFNMHVIAYDLYPSDRAKELGVQFMSLDEVLGEADFVSLHAAVTEESRGMISAEQFGQMKSSAFLVNTARGALVDEDALADALNGGKIAGAALDAYCVEPLPQDSPLRQAKNTLMTPHVASLTTDNGRRISESASSAVASLAEGRPPEHLLNPEVLMSSNLRATLV